MQALAVLTFCAFFGGTKMADFNISSVSGVLSPALAESLLMAVPPCQFTGANASIHIIHPNGTTDVRHFTVPLCRGRRELVSVVDSTGGFTVTRLDAYQITRLTPGHTYTISYSVFNKDRSVSKSNSIAMGTLNSALGSLPLRSGLQKHTCRHVTQWRNGGDHSSPLHRHVCLGCWPHCHAGNHEMQVKQDCLDMPRQWLSLQSRAAMRMREGDPQRNTAWLLPPLFLFVSVSCG
ncbi:uroplakin-2 isoform X1 [Alligator mississippiensis]|uniref:uroplakin-2 isoform X1 n=1 Tax=Alligator mississippiensis TaxID=8496 RepID=UPI0028776C1F|nr:uroplakin-2 isoform X1 [Alligator mississippiensis]